MHTQDDAVGLDRHPHDMPVRVPAGDIGTASGLLRSFGYIGSIASSATIAIVFRTHVSDHGLHVIAIIMIAVNVVALLLTLADRQLMSLASTRRQPPAQPAPDPSAEPARERKH